MKKRLLASVFSVSLLVLPFSSSAQTSEIDAALERMDAIIAQMQTLRAEFAALSAHVGTVAATPAVQGATAATTLGDDLAYGSTNDDIARIQRLLATDPTIYAYGVDSGFFGPKTQEAIRLFQSRFGLDTVGVIGPSTRALLETFFAAYPDENYPADVLKQAVPQVAGAATSNVATVVTPTPAVADEGLKSISLDEDDGEYIVRSYNQDGSRNRDMVLYPDDFDELMEMIADKLDVSESVVRALIDEDDTDFDGKDDDDDELDADDYSESSAEDWLEAADDAIDEARDEIGDADDDGDDVDEADDLYDEAKEEYEKAEDAFDDEDWRDAVKNAEDAIELAEEAIDAIGSGDSNSDEIEEIRVDVKDGEADVEVEYEDGDEDDFTVNEDDEDDIIKEIADELDMDEDDVEDLVEFDYGNIESVYAYRSGGDTMLRIEFTSGLEAQFVTDETDEDDIIELVADEFDLDEDDVERVIEFDL